MVVPFWTPITPLTGSLLHADPQSRVTLPENSHSNRRKKSGGRQTRKSRPLAWLQNGDADEGRSRKVDILDLDDLKALDF
jgi:hypothetical protein